MMGAVSWTQRSLQSSISKVAKLVPEYPEVVDFLPNVRVPLEWQHVKEHAWTHPLVLAGCLTTAGSAWASWSCAVMLISGSVVSGFFFRGVLFCAGLMAKSFQLPGFQAWPLFGGPLAGPSARAGAAADGALAVGLPDEARVVRHPWQLCALAIADSSVPALIAGTAYMLQLMGELGRPRLEWLLRAAYATLAWSSAGLWLFASLCRQWEMGMCRRLEAERDATCQSGVSGKLGPIFGQLPGLVCHLETAAECEMLILALYAYLLLAFASLAGTLLCIVGLGRARQELEAKWALQRQGKPTAPACPPGSDFDERRGLLA